MVAEVLVVVVNAGTCLATLAHNDAKAIQHMGLYLEHGDKAKLLLRCLSIGHLRAKWTMFLPGKIPSVLVRQPKAKEL